jgi:hypothetical protein
MTRRAVRRQRRDAKDGGGGEGVELRRVAAELDARPCCLLVVDA